MFLASVARIGVVATGPWAFGEHDVWSTCQSHGEYGVAALTRIAKDQCEVVID
jgi:hypothetical protein